MQPAPTVDTPSAEQPESAATDSDRGEMPAVDNEQQEEAQPQAGDDIELEVQEQLDPGQRQTLVDPLG